MLYGVLTGNMTLWQTLHVTRESQPCLQYSGYYDYQARKKKKPTLNARELTENANILLVELCYYSCKQGFQGVCCYCADAEAYKPQEFLRNFHTVLPICDACRASKPVVTRMPKAGIKRKKTFCQTLNV